MLIFVSIERFLYGFEYRGCGLVDYIVTPYLESCLIATLVTIADHRPVFLQSDKQGTGRQALSEFAAHLSGKFFVYHSLSTNSDSKSLKKLIKSCLVDGSWLMLRNLESTSVDVISTLSSILSSVHDALSHPHSPGIIQV